MSEVEIPVEVLEKIGTYQPIPNASFSTEDPYLQVVWDSTSLGTLKSCPWKYFLQVVCGYVPKKPSIHLEFGKAYHSALELYEKLKSAGATAKEAMHQTAHCAAWHGKSIPEGDNRKTMQTLVRSVVWYIDTYWNDSAKTIQLTNGKPAVELSFNFHFADIGGVSFYLAGHIDRLVEFAGSPWFLDYKTTTGSLNPTYFKNFSPDNQMDLYTFGGQVVWDVPLAGGIVDGAELKVNFTRFKRQEIHRTPEQIDEYIADTHMWLETAKRYAESRHWPKNEKSCGDYGGCPFRHVCSQSPSVRETLLKVDYARRAWSPATAR